MLSIGEDVKYTRLTKTLKDKGILIPSSEVYNNITDFGLDWYRSVFFYTDEHYARFMKEHTVRGIYDVKTNFLIWDFDSEDDIDKARKDTIELVTRLISNGIRQDSFNVCFSGNKGFSVEMEIDAELNTNQFKLITKALAKDLVTRDTKIVNPSRVFRIPFTKHQVSGLYKIPLTLKELSELSTDQIKKLAASQGDVSRWNTGIVSLPKSLIPEEGTQEHTKNIAETPRSVEELDFSKKPKDMPSCKYAIMNGFFEQGNRSHSLIALAAHFRNQGFPKEVAYHAVKGASKMQSARTGQKEFSKDEIWNNIIAQVYSSYWKGGTYSCKDHDFLKEICDSLGENACGSKELIKDNSVVRLGDITKKFGDFAKNIEKNRIYTGIKKLDEHLMLTIGMPVGLLGSPGAGKTAMALNILNHSSQQNVKSMFCSLDMAWNVVYAKMLSRQTGINFKQIVELYKQDDDRLQDWNEQLIEDFSNVSFTFKSGTSIDGIRDMILKEEEHSGEKVKLVVIDYLECLVGPYGDPTANGAYQASKIKDLATDLSICVIVLVQPPKSAGDPSKPLTSMRQIKGASALEQNFRAVVSVHREGFSPSTPEDDKFITINCLKNTMGGLFSIDMGWEGVTGGIRELSQKEKAHLNMIRDRNDEADDKKDKWS